LNEPGEENNIAELAHPSCAELISELQEFSISCTWAYALFMARHGFKVFLLKKRSKEPLFIGWQHLATNDENVIRDWARSYPDYNYGILTGNYFFVIDWDGIGPNQIEVKITELQAKLGT